MDETPLDRPAAKQRRPGRPQAGEGNVVSPAVILRTAYEMAKTVPLQELSIVQVAKALGVTPALIHYHVGGRDWLTSGIMNLFYRDLINKWPAFVYNWQDDIFLAAKVVYEHFVEYAGVTSYVLLHNRFRIFQLIHEGQVDYGVEMLERFTTRVAAARAPASKTGVYAHMLLEFIISSAHAAVSHRYPSDYQKFLIERVDALNSEQYPTIRYVRESLVSLKADEAFSEGCRLFILGLRSDLADLGGPANAAEALPRSSLRLKKSKPSQA